ncbi:MAG: sigma-70 family RNA polymerase sigma factor [bacterium]|nr:sigma-70 family RNA polymerase sigma factor [bacterium]
MSTSSDSLSALLARVKNGDDAAFDLVYERYFTPVFRYIVLRVRNRELAEDLTQTVFLKAWQARDRYTNAIGRDSAALAYLFTIARNAVIDYHRRKKEVPMADAEKVFAAIPDDRPDPEKRAENRQRAAELYRAMACLSNDQQEVVLLRYINDLATGDIARLMGKTEEAVRQLQCRALKALRRYHNSGMLS